LALLNFYPRRSGAQKGISKCIARGSGGGTEPKTK
jgi:hypothetical protein